MYAIVANGIQTIVKTSEQLDVILGLFPYPKFQKVNTEVEGREWIRNNSRISYASDIRNYGETSKYGYAEIDYFISNNNIFYNVDTSKLGYIRVESSDNVLVDSRPELLKVKVLNVVLDNSLIAHHVIAIHRVLVLLGDYVDVSINVPDMSVYLALTKYTGTNYMIKRTQDLIKRRLASVSFTVAEGLDIRRETFEDVFDL